MKNYQILTINPGSTSTKIAYFINDKAVNEVTIRHSSDELKIFNNIIDQLDYRLEVINDILEKEKIDIKKLDCIVGRGGLLKPIKSGTYSVNENMLKDLTNYTYGEHASNLGGLIAKSLADKVNIPAYIVDPVVVDEMEPIARISGIPEIERKSIFHALNQKAVAKRVACELDKNYNDCNFVVVHLGGGISVGAHYKGKVIDVNNALDGDGPFSPERSGGLPVGDLLSLLDSKIHTYKELKKRITGNGGIVAYLNSNNCKEVVNMINDGNKQAELIYKAMAYQVAKEIGAQTTVLKGDIDAIILTGGIAYDELLISWIKESVSFLGKIIVVPGEDEMLALATGGLNALRGLEETSIYK